MTVNAHGIAGAGNGTAAALGAGDCLSLAAAPTFAAMALLTGALGGDASGTMCPPAHHASPLTGMAAMYLLMCGFHAAPWLRLIAGLRPAVGSRASAVGGEASPTRGKRVHDGSTEEA